MSEEGDIKTGAVGAVLDEAYRLTRLIFEGAMGTVYEAVQLRLNKRVAIKVMVRELADNQEALARFRQEIEVTSQLAHPHVIQLLDFGALPSGEPYLVMEYLAGEDLERRLARVGRLSVEATVQIVRQLASALEATHASGIVHRDLKPANVFLVPMGGGEDFVKLVDFGISKVRTAQTQLTRAFTMVGTPEYMSTGRVDEVDHCSDQWALACMVWRMLSGRSPFEGTDLVETVNRIVGEDPPPLPELPGLAPDVEKVLRRALAKNRDDRFPIITAFSRALQTAATPPSVPVTVRPAPESTRPPPTAGAGLRSALLTAVIMAALFAGGALLYRSRMTPPTAPAAPALLDRAPSPRPDDGAKRVATKRPKPGAESHRARRMDP
jgi:eukaryotic-like serine/threonine-protein kinase